MLDNELLIRVKKSDGDAFRQLFDLYAPRVFSFVNQYVRTKAEGEDLTQTVFLRIWEKRAQLNVDRNPEALIFTIARNLLIDHFRQTARRIQEMPLIADNLEVNSSMRADDQVMFHQITRIYRQALEALPPRRRDIFTLSRHEGMSNREIAQKMGLSIKTVENQMTAALAFIRDFLSREDVGTALLISFFIQQWG